MIPVYCRWSKLDIVRTDGEIVELFAMVPIDRFERHCLEQFELGENYRMEVVEERSAASHKHYHAVLNEAWKTLPESKKAQYPTVNRMRSRLLIKAGYSHTSYKEFETPQIAARVAAFMKPLNEDDYVEAKGTVVMHSRAKSQSRSEMDKAEFEASKRDVLALLDEILGTPQGTVKREAGKSA